MLLQSCVDWWCRLHWPMLVAFQWQGCARLLEILGGMSSVQSVPGRVPDEHFAAPVGDRAAGRGHIVNLDHCQWGATSVQECDISCEQSRHGILCKWQLSCRSWPTQLCAVCHSWPRLFAVTIHRHSHLNAFTESLSWTMVW